MLVSDQNNLYAKKYGVYGLKKFMGKEYHGVNRSTFLLDKNGKIIKIYEKLKPTNHSKEVLELFLRSKEIYIYKIFLNKFNSIYRIYQFFYYFFIHIKIINNNLVLIYTL